MTALTGFLDGVTDGDELFRLAAIDFVVLIQTRHGNVGRNFHDIQIIDVHKLFCFGESCAGHACQLLIEAEIVLEGDRRHRHVFSLDRNVFLGFECLVQAFGEAAAWHHAAGEFIDDDDLTVLDDVILVELEKFVRAHGLLHVVDDGDVGTVVECLPLE